MTNQQPQENRAVFTTPRGRWVSGSLTQGRDKDDYGVPYVYKTGKHQGKPYLRYSIGLAIPKRPGVDWKQTAWGQQLTTVGLRFRSDAITRGDEGKFSWKVKDGDSAVLNENNRAPKDNEGWPGHWVIFFSCNQLAVDSTGQGPRAACPLWTLWDEATQSLKQPPRPLEVGRIKRGDYVQLSCTIEPNDDVKKPGIYVNLNMLCMLGEGDAIIGGPDVQSANFGQNLDDGDAPAPAPAAQHAAPPLPAQPPTPPNQAFANPPPVPQPPAAPPVPPAGPVMTDKARAEGLTYDILKGGGWSDEQMKQHGYMA